jgi:hypothetical protein
VGKKDKSNLIEILRKIFEADPGKPTIDLKDTAGIWIQHGDDLFRCLPDPNFVKYPDCFTVNAKMDHASLKKELLLQASTFKPNTSEK